jgi:hypothetical protein
MNMRHPIALLALPSAVLACSEVPPASPSWDLNVYPILRGNCGHCHGATVKPEYTPTTRYDICTSAPFNTFFASEQLWIAGVDAMGRPIVAGANPMAGLLTAYTKPDAPAQLRMPPPPASPLSDYEREVLQKWADVNQASCNKQTPNRKPEMKIVSMAAAVPGSNKVALTLEVSDPDGDVVYGYAKLGNAAPQVIPGAGRYALAFEGVRASDTLVVKLHDGYDAGP